MAEHRGGGLSCIQMDHILRSGDPKKASCPFMQWHHAAQQQNAFCSGKALSGNGLPGASVSARACGIAGGVLLFAVQGAVQARQRRQQALVYGAQALQVPHQYLLPLP